MLLLPTSQELFGKDFLSFLVHRNPELRGAISEWLKQVKAAGTTEQHRVELFLKVGPQHVLQAAQEDFIRQGKPQHKQSSTPSSSSAAAMQPGQGNNNAYLTPQQQQAAQQAALMANLRGQAGQAAVAWGGLPQQQQARTVSPVPGQQSQAAAVTQQLYQQGLLQQYIMAQQQQRLQSTSAVTSQLAQPGRSRGPAAASTAAGRAPGAAGLASVGSAGNLASLASGGIPVQQAAVAAAAAAAGVSLQRPSSAGLTAAAAAAAAAAAGRPLSAAGPMFPRPMVLNPAAAAAVATADAAVKAQVQQALKGLKAGEAPKMEPPDGHEWVQCMGKDGKPGWFAVVRAKAAAMRTAASNKRKAEEAAAGQPASKQGTAGGKRKTADDDLVKGGGPVSMLLMDEDAVEAEEAAAKGAVVVEAGNVQEEYLLNPNPTLTLVARAAKEGGVKAVSDAVYPYLSLAAEAFLAQLLNNMVKIRLQREDLGKGYFGAVPADKTQGDLRAKLYKMREEEKRKAQERAAAERDELAKLGASRKKLGDEERKAAQAAKQQRDIEQKKASVGSTLSLLGIRHQAFSSLGKAANKTGASKTAFTKPELLEAKAVASGAADGTGGAAAAAAAPAAAAPAGSLDPAAVKAEPGTAAAAAAAAGATHDRQVVAGSSSNAAAAAAAAAAPSGTPPLKPMSLQHQLLSVADLQPSVTPLVAGGVSARKARDGEEAFRELMLQDLVAVLERHPLYCRSPELHTLHALAALQLDSQR